MAKSPNWSSLEISYLKQNYPTLGVKGCIKELSNRTEKSINIKASRLGLKMLDAWNRKLSTKEYIDKLVSKNISYMPTEEYILDDTEINHICNICDNTWKVRPNNILNGSGCPSCNKGFGWLGYIGTSVFAKLYIIKITTNTEVFLKVGITTNTIKRFSAIKKGIGSEFLNLEVICIFNNISTSILKIEQYLLNIYSKNRFITKYYFGGYTELFNIDIQDRLINSVVEYFIENEGVVYE